MDNHTGTFRDQLIISENYLVSMIATVQTDLQKKINNLCKKYRIELEADESALMGTGIDRSGRRWRSGECGFY